MRERRDPRGECGGEKEPDVLEGEPEDEGRQEEDDDPEDGAAPAERFARAAAQAPRRQDDADDAAAVSRGKPEGPRWASSPTPEAGTVK